MRIISLKIILLAAFMLSSTSAFAHHSFAADFKSDEFNTVEGVVTDFRFRNPHVVIYLDVSNTDGSVTNWMVVGSAATGWRQAGWGNDSLKSGDMLRVTGSATHDGSPMVSNDEMYMLNPSSGEVLAELTSNEDPAVSLGNAAEAAAEDTQLTFLPARLPTGEPNFTGTTARIDGFGRGGPDANDQFER